MLQPWSEPYRQSLETTKKRIWDEGPDVANLPTPDESKQELITAAAQVKEELKQRMSHAEKNSMPNRMRAVVEAMVGTQRVDVYRL